MLTADFDFDLPAELIAQKPLARGESRLLYLPAGTAPTHHSIRDLPSLLAPGDLLVVNNTRVLKARLFGTLPTGGRIEVLLAEKHGDAVWDCLARPGRKARPGVEIRFARDLVGEVVGRRADGRIRLSFSMPPEPHLERIGHVPLPPYIKREDSADDADRYQTIYASSPGAIAAPTAGLHFDQELTEAVAGRGIAIAELTLHVGIGTFKPVTAELVHEHVMDSERFAVTPECASRIQDVKAKGGRVVAVGTTVVRTLEAVAKANNGEIVPASGSSDLFITPGFDFRIVDLLLTNFHLPRSTLLMLVSALAGKERMLAAYAEAVRNRYRFYSYGDAMLLERPARPPVESHGSCP